MLENLTKGIIIGETPGKLKKVTNMHNMEWLLTQAGLANFNDYEMQLCEKLTAYSTWAGRYPGPKPGKTNGMNDLFVLDADFDIVRKWEKKLTAKLVEIASRKTPL
jgi:hypothetical protein